MSLSAAADHSAEAAIVDFVLHRVYRKSTGAGQRIAAGNPRDEVHVDIENNGVEQRTLKNDEFTAALDPATIKGILLTTRKLVDVIIPPKFVPCRLRGFPVS
jgi:hypothetical protein